MPLFLMPIGQPRLKPSVKRVMGAGVAPARTGLATVQEGRDTEVDHTAYGNKYRSLGPTPAAEKDEYLNSVCCRSTLSKKSKIQACEKFFPTAF
jgi:hypothetical protein